MQEDIERLVMEAQRARFTERRTEPRHTFVRPVSIYQGDKAGLECFSKDISTLGIGIVTQQEFEVGAQAILRIHSVSGYPVFVRSEVRWCDRFGKGWFVTGWKYIASASPPAQSYRE